MVRYGMATLVSFLQSINLCLFRSFDQSKMSNHIPLQLFEEQLCILVSFTFLRLRRNMTKNRPTISIQIHNVSSFQIAQGHPAGFSDCGLFIWLTDKDKINLFSYSDSPNRLPEPELAECSTIGLEPFQLIAILNVLVLFNPAAQ